MRKFAFLTLLFCVGVISSCKKVEQINPKNVVNANPSLFRITSGYGPFQTFQVQDVSTLANVVSYINNNIPTIRYNNKDVSFDLTKLYQTKGEGSTITTYYVKSTNQFDSVEFALAPIYNSDSSKITSYMVVKTTILSDNVKRIDYLGNNDQIVYSIEVNLIDQTVQLLKAGQATMNCITDFYSNHGWVSVGLWVGTLLDPGIGVTVAAACAVGQSFHSL